MASSSSAKKVARVAAKSGSGPSSGTSAGSGRNWLFALGIVVIIGLGVGVVAMARNENSGLGNNTTPPKANLQNGEPFDHWHAAFEVQVCGTEVARFEEGATGGEGIHTHGDGLVHIEPITRSSAGERATLGRFFENLGFEVTDSGFQLPAGMTLEDGATTVKEGETKCGGKDGELVLAQWKDAKTAADNPPDKIYRSGFGDVRFIEDLGAFTLAFVPKGSEVIQAPSSAAEIDTSGGVAPGGAPAGGAPATVPVPPTGAETVPETVPESGSAGSGG